MNKGVTTKINNKSPLRYPGGKTRACKCLDDIFNMYFNPTIFNTLVSPFFGGGSFEFYLQNKYGYKIIANDKFTPLYNFWVACKNNKKILCAELHKKIGNISKVDFHNLRENIMEETDPLLQAKYYFIINRCSFSGATLSGGFSSQSSKDRFTTSSIERVENLNLTNTTFHNLDFECFINDCYYSSNDCVSGEKRVHFLDPPYYLEKKSTLYGKNGDMHENFDHTKLRKCLGNKKNWIMTYNDCEYIRNLYSDFTIVETSWVYGMNASKKSSEIVIICAE